MKTAYVVLGMHRSGTSSVAGALVQLGATAPLTLMSPKPENPKGFWESEAIMEFNDRLLALCGSSWRDWRALDTTPLLDFDEAPGLRQEALAVLDAEFGQCDRIVLKDPRMCRLFPFWAQVLSLGDYRPVVITPLRSPSEVAASLAARNEMSLQFGWRLWLQHVLSAERDTRGFHRHFMAWDAFLSDWRGQVAIMDERLGQAFEITAEAEQSMSTFLAPELKHHSVSRDPAMSALPHEVYKALLSLAESGENFEAMQRLSFLDAAFADVAQLFSDAL